MKSSLIALVLAAATPFAASAADGISYSYADANYIKTNDTNNGGDAEGWSVKGSQALLPNLHVFAGFNRQETDLGKVDVEKWNIGAGYNLELAPAVDLVVRGAYQKLDVKHGPSFDGYTIEAGVRAAYGKHVEVYGLAGYEDYSKRHGIDLGDDVYGRLGAVVKITKNWGIDGELKLNGDGEKEWSVGPRFTW